MEGGLVEEMILVRQNFHSATYGRTAEPLCHSTRYVLLLPLGLSANARRVHHRLCRDRLPDLTAARARKAEVQRAYHSRAVSVGLVFWPCFVASLDSRMLHIITPNHKTDSLARL